MKKILILIFFIVNACGYQPIYKVDKEIPKIKIKEVITASGLKKTSANLLNLDGLIKNLNIICI